MRCRTPSPLLALAAVLAAGNASTQQPSTALPAARVQQLARELDAALELNPGKTVDDETFCRRAYLTIVGRIPTPDELAAFTKDSGPDRDGRLIDRLLLSAGHVSHQFNLWADVLRLTSRLMQQQSGEPYQHFVEQSLAENKPYDRFVRELLTADGPANARGNGATGYYLRDLGMPLDNMSNTMRIFVGTRMECAQCHDHPFDTWTQRQFYELAAFTGGMTYRAEAAVGGNDPRQTLTQLRDLRGKLGEDGRRALVQLQRQIASGVSGSGTASIALPKDYKYEDLDPGAVVHAKTPFGSSVEVEPQRERGAARRPRARPQQGGRERTAADSFAQVGSRSAFADWVTSRDNPRFTKVIVNRIWQEAYGRGFTPVVDEFRDDVVVADPKAFAYLEQMVADLGYDLREVRRVVYRSALFRRVAVPLPDAGATDFDFTGPLLRRMSAEQLWDSLLTAVIGDPDRTLPEPGAKAELVYRNHERLVASARDDLPGLIEKEALRYKDPAAYRRQLAQEMAMRAPTTTDAPMPSEPDRAEQLRELGNELREARQKGDRRKVAELMQKLADLRDRANSAALRRNPEIARASEIQQPARPGHFLREFGQSDRDQISTGTTESNVPQALRLMNGIVDQQLLARGSKLARDLDLAKSATTRLEVAYATLLSRRPTAHEVRTWRADLERDPVTATKDLVWTLVNSQEFRFLR